MIFKFLSSARARLTVGGLVLAGVAGGLVHAQATSAPADNTAQSLNLPSDVALLGQSNPNVRTATAIVNGEIITGTDVDQRLALIIAANGGKVADDERVRLRAQVLRNLIDETLQIQEAKAQDIAADNSEVDDTYSRVAQQNFRQSPAALDKYLISVGSSSNSLKRQIRGELSWQRLLRRNVQPFVNVSDDEVREMLDRLKASKGTEEYRLGEIFLSATAENKAAVQANAMKIVTQLKQGGSFVAYARQFSEASTAAVGGDLGYIRLGQLPAELAQVAQGMEAGQLVGPVEIPGGFSILYLIDKRKVLTADPRDAVLSLKQVSLDFPAGMAPQQRAAKAKAFADGIRSIRGCGEVDARAASLGATVVTSDQVKARDLPGQLQQIVLGLNIGEATPPFGSMEEGVRVLMLCGRDDPQVSDGPSFEDLMDQLTEERVNKRAQSYLRDLRRDAVIEYR